MTSHQRRDRGPRPRIAITRRTRFEASPLWAKVGCVVQVLRMPPGNRLEALGRERSGQHSIHVSDQWRICFVWRDGDAYDVEILDSH